MSAFLKNLWRGLAAGVYLSEAPPLLGFCMHGMEKPFCKFGIWSNTQCITPVYALHKTRSPPRYTLYKYIDLCWNFKQSMGARTRIKIGLPYRPAELVSRNRFLGSLKVLKFGICIYSHREGDGEGGSEPMRRLEGQYFTSGVENNNMFDCISRL